MIWSTGGDWRGVRGEERMRVGKRRRVAVRAYMLGGCGGASGCLVS